MISTLFHVATGLCGLMLAAIALFLTEDQEGKIQNRLEELWVRVDDLSTGAMRWEAALMQQASKMLTNALDGLFGQKLWSWRAVATSTGLSSTSICVGLFLTEIYVNHSHSPYGLVWVAVFCALSSVAPGKLRFLALLSAPLLAIWVVLQTDSQEYHYVKTTAVVGTTVVMAGSVLSDFFAIMIIRVLLKRSSELRSTWKLVSVMLLESCIGFALVAVFIIYLINPSAIARFMLACSEHFRWDNDDWQTTALSGLWVFVFDVSVSNLITALMCILVVLLLVAALIHRLMWPVLARPIYALQRFGVIRHPKLLAALSAICLLFAWPHSSAVVALAKILHLPND